MDWDRVGSPPRVRGKVRAGCRPTCNLRITPACAGKSLAGRYADGVEEDHPRVCGEKCICGGDHRHRVGSPPRVRGKGIALIMTIILLGITPACAGKSQRFPAKIAWRWDHPRVCGEKCDGRGHDRGAGGITPACAGKRTAQLPEPKGREDHPRVCGEKLRALRP